MPRFRLRHSAYDLEATEKIYSGAGRGIPKADAGNRSHAKGEAGHGADSLCGHSAALSADPGRTVRSYALGDGTFIRVYPVG